MGSRSDSTTSMTGYLAADGFEAQLEQELARDVIRARHGRLILDLSAGAAGRLGGEHLVRLREIEFEFISQAATSLRAMQRNWALYPQRLHRRASLIQDKLPHVSAKPLRFSVAVAEGAAGFLDCCWTPTGCWRRRAAPAPSPTAPSSSSRTDRRRPTAPISSFGKRFTLIGRRPQAGELCLDLGASPGGWSWVLQSLGARVIAVDRAPLDPDIAALPGVDYRAMSAFALEPQEIGPVDWLCSDIVCYPAKLLELVQRWLECRLARNFVCTIKFQGDTDHGAAAQFCRHSRQPR